MIDLFLELSEDWSKLRWSSKIDFLHRLFVGLDHFCNRSFDIWVFLVVDGEAVFNSILAHWYSAKPIEWESFVSIVGAHNLADFLYCAFVLIVPAKIV